MKDKTEIVDNWLPRYTGVPLDQFGEHILLTNFGGYLNAFSQLTGAPDRRPGPADAQRDRRRHHHDQLRHGQPERGDDDGPALGDHAQGGAVPGQVRRPEEEERARRPGAADRGDPRRRHQQRLPAAGSAGAARVRPAARGLDHDPRPGPRLLDRHRVHHQPPRLGTRRRVQGIPAQAALHGHRHGNRDHLRRRLRQPHSLRRAAAGQRPADDPGRGEDRGVGCAGSAPISSIATSTSASRR